MKIIKTVLKMVLGLAIGIIAGLLIASVIVVLTTDATFADFFSKLTGADLSVLAIGLFVGLAAFAVSFLVLVPIHELGHLVGGLLTGYRFVSFRVFNYTVIKHGGRLAIRKYAVAGTGGQCLLLPPELPLSEIPTFWYNAGGVVANIIALLLVLPLLWVDNAIVHEATFIFILTDAFFILLNGIPMQPSGIGNDGYNALMLSRESEAKRGLILQLRSYALIQKGVRSKDMPDDWFAMPQSVDYKNALEVSIPVMIASRRLDMMDYDGATRLYEELYAHRNEIMPLYVKEIACELVYLYLVAGRKTQAESLLDDSLRHYFDSEKRFVSSADRLRCAIGLYIDGDADKAHRIYDDLRSRESSYLLQGEVKSDIALLSALLER